jgi:preprotein translocase subunit SecY
MIAKFNVPFYFGGTALLIIVGVAIDTVAQMESHMLARHYEGFMKKAGPLKGRYG